MGVLCPNRSTFFILEKFRNNDFPKNVTYIYFSKELQLSGCVFIFCAVNVKTNKNTTG